MDSCIKKLEKIKKRIELILTYTDDERVLAQCNLISKEINKVSEDILKGGDENE